jgi:hypothetical protein
LENLNRNKMEKYRIERKFIKKPLPEYALGIMNEIKLWAYTNDFITIEE